MSSQDRRVALTIGGPWLGSRRCKVIGSISRLNRGVTAWSAMYYCMVKLTSSYKYMSGPLQ